MSSVVKRTPKLKNQKKRSLKTRELREKNKMTKKKLLTMVRERIRVKHYSIRTERAYLDWIYRFIVFHNKKHPQDMGAEEIQNYLNYLAVQLNVAASTQNQALNAINFLYKEVLQIDFDKLEQITWAKKPKKYRSFSQKAR